MPGPHDKEVNIIRHILPNWNKPDAHVVNGISPLRSTMILKRAVCGNRFIIMNSQ